MIMHELSKDRVSPDKFTAVIDRVVELTNAGRPVLVGTTDVANTMYCYRRYDFNSRAGVILGSIGSAARNGRKRARVCAPRSRTSRRS